MYAARIQTEVTLAVVKISILLLYRRIFTTRTFLRVNLAVGCLVLSSATAIALAAVFRCNPIADAWAHQARSGCFDTRTFYVTTKAIDFFTDVLVLLLPMPMVWQLHLPLKKRVFLCILFAIGSLYVSSAVSNEIAASHYVHSANVSGLFLRQSMHPQHLSHCPLSQLQNVRSNRYPLRPEPAVHIPRKRKRCRRTMRQVPKRL